MFGVNRDSGEPVHPSMHEGTSPKWWTGCSRHKRLGSLAPGYDTTTTFGRESRVVVSTAAAMAVAGAAHGKFTYYCKSMTTNIRSGLVFYSISLDPPPLIQPTNLTLKAKEAYLGLKVIPI